MVIYPGMQASRCDFCGNPSLYRGIGGIDTVKGCNKFYCVEHGARDLSNLCLNCSQSNVSRKYTVIIAIVVGFFLLYYLL